jgi:hypothetical protein
MHAFLGASRYHWVNYDFEKLEIAYKNHQAATLGTRLHAFAKDAIDLGIKMPKNTKTLNMYINDAIGFQMKTEQVLFYSDNAFGTADAISFKNNILRIHDLKTGLFRANVKQLEIYVALFCLEYNFKPQDINIETRIYQNNEVLVHVPINEDICFVMNKIIEFSYHIDKLKQ